MEIFGHQLYARYTQLPVNYRCLTHDIVSLMYTMNNVEYCMNIDHTFDIRLRINKFHLEIILVLTIR